MPLDRWLGRWWPGQLRYRLVLATLLVLILSHLLAFPLYQAGAVRQSDVASAAGLGAVLADVVKLAVDAGGAAADLQALAKPATPELEVTWLPNGPPPLPAGWVRQELTLSGLPIVLVSEEPIRARATDGPPEVAFALLAEDLAAANCALRLAAETGNGRWISINSPRLWRRHLTPFQLLLLSIALAGGTVWLMVLLSARTVREVEQLSELVGQPTDVVEPKPMRIRGPEEVRAIAAAINKTRSALGEQVEGRTRLLAAISHDLRTPATRLRLRVEYVEDDVLRTKLLQDVDELSKMISSALEFFSEDVIREETETISFSSLLQSLCDDFADMGLPVTFQEPPPLRFGTVRTAFSGAERQDSFPLERQLRLSGRPASLRRAFSNLIDNAIKYGKHAVVSVDADSKEIIVEIVDDGPGIPEEEMQNVFKPFFRLDDSRNRQTGGAGLGLSIVKSVVDAHQGKIELINRMRGGLRVRVTLPRML